MSIMFYGFRKFSQWVSRYNLYSTLHFASDHVANRRNRPAISPHRVSPKAPTFGASHKMQRTLQVVQLRSLG